MNQTDIQEDSKPWYNLLQSLSLVLVWKKVNLTNITEDKLEFINHSINALTHSYISISKWIYPYYVYIFPSTNGFTHIIISIINQFSHTIYSGSPLKVNWTNRSQLGPTLDLLSAVKVHTTRYYRFYREQLLGPHLLRLPICFLILANINLNCIENITISVSSSINTIPLDLISFTQDNRSFD